MFHTFDLFTVTMVRNDSNLLPYIGRRDIEELRVGCSGECRWEGTLGTLEQHLATCNFAEVPCPKECKNGAVVRCVSRRDLDRHLRDNCPNRDYRCLHCGESGTYATITRRHYSRCLRIVIPCPNSDCVRRFQRRRIRRHLEECVHTALPCRYHKLGCNVELKRAPLTAHEQDSALHLQMAIDMVTEQEDKIENLQETVEELNETVGGMEENVQDLENTVDDLKESNDDLKDSTENVLKNNGSITFELADFEERREANDGFVSPSFYTSPNGYLMAIVVYPNGSDETLGTHLSVYVSLQEGQYDDKLKWPFIGRVDITLLNQLEDKNHMDGTVLFTVAKNAHSDDDSDWGIPAFCSRGSLSEDRMRNTRTRFLLNDTLYFRVSVDVLDHRPWLECTTK